jgi:hypothetical protein
MILGGVFFLFKIFYDENSHMAMMLSLTSSVCLLGGFLLFCVGIYVLIQNYLQNIKEINYMVHDLRCKLEKTDAKLSENIVKLYENQSKLNHDLPKIFDETNERINIVGLTLVSFVWNSDLKSSLKKALDRGVKVRVLMLNHNSQALDFIATQEGRNSESYFSELRKSMSMWQDISNTNSNANNAIEVRLYDQLPIPFMLFSDDRLFYRALFQSAGGYLSPCLEIKGKSGAIYRACEYEFMKLWENSILSNNIVM